MSRKEKKDWSLDTLLSIVGFVFELVRVIVNALQKRGGTIEHLRRLLKEQDLVDKVFDLVVPAGSEVERPLGENEYRVPVSYDMPRDKEKLESEFSKDGVSELFYGNYVWQPHSSCAEIDQTPGERIMLVKHFGRDTTSKANIVEMDKLGYRPATHLEAYAFAKVNPELQRQFWIVALGSSTMYGDLRGVAVLCSGSGRRIFDYRWFDREWYSDFRFLFVRK